MKIAIVSSPYSKGRDAGDASGPSAILAAGLVERLRGLGHDVAEPAVASSGSAPVGDEMAVIEAAGGEFAVLIRTARADDALCIALEGDCTAAPSVVAGLEPDGRVGLLWIDSHGDFNTPETTPSGMLGGMPVAVATGRCFPSWQSAVGIHRPLRDEDVLLAGIRDLDPPERAALEASRVEVVEWSDSASGGDARLSAAIERLSRSVDTLYIHVDVDVLNPETAVGFTMPVPGGPTPDQLAAIVAQAASTGKLAALGIAAFNPQRDADGRTMRAILQTIEATINASISQLS